MTATTWVGSMEGELIRLESATKQAMVHWQLPGVVRAMYASSDGDRIGVVCGDSLYEVASYVGPDTRAEATDGIGSPLTVTAVDDSTTFVIARQEKTVHLWRVEDDAWKSVWRRDGVIAADISLDGRFLYLATSEGRLDQVPVSTLAAGRPRMRAIHQDRRRWRDATMILGWEACGLCEQRGTAAIPLRVPSHGRRPGHIRVSGVLGFRSAKRRHCRLAACLFTTDAGNIIGIALSSGRTAETRAVSRRQCLDPCLQKSADSSQSHRRMTCCAGQKTVGLKG